METKSAPVASAPPHLIHAITAGFNVVASHIYLILFPIALDLLLWFGPRLRIHSLLQPALKEFFDLMQQSVPQPEMREVVQSARQIWELGAQHLNLFSGLRAFPVGVPSLLGAEGPLKSPLGSAPLFEMPSLGAAFTTWLVISLVGLLFGSYYFYLIARISSSDMRPSSLGTLGWQTGQALFLLFLLLVLVLLLSFPVLIMLAVMVNISPDLTQIAMVLMGISLLWLLYPLVFAPHAIFTFQIDAPRSMLLSYRLVRSYLPGTSLFLLISILISQGLDTLWRIPPEDSWMRLVGILGHAFISTGLITASFIYFIRGVKWMQENLHQRDNVGVRI